jgi:class 3 adenylate cyclase
VEICRNCGQENPEIAKFCLACGSPLGDPGAKRRQERRIVSVIFVDLVGFTGRAEKIDPEDVEAVLAPYHEGVRREIESYGGVVEKFIGDAVVGVFGAPTAFGDDPERAVRASFCIRDNISQLEANGVPLDLRMRIAVNTGEALVTLDARPELGEAMVAGDVMNTAARMQQHAPESAVIVGEETWRATRDMIEYVPNDEIVAKGKTDPLRTWIAVRATRPEGDRNLPSTLVGRKRELAMLRDIWDQVIEQRSPRLVTVLAPAGVGKTRLGAEFAQIVEDEGTGVTVRGRSLPYRESVAYGAFASQVKQICGIFENDSPEVAMQKLRHVTDTPSPSEVASHLAILIGATPDVSVPDRESLFFSVRCFIEAVVRERPMVLVFEDLHWADSSLLDLVELLGGRLRDLPILILVLARLELLDARPSWGGGLLSHTALPLAPLGEKEAQQLVAERLGAAGGADHLDRAAELAQTAGGNPLFIEQLAAALSETSAPNGSLPTTIRGLVSARLDALPAEERAVLLDASAGGKVFWRGAIELTDSGGDKLGQHLTALERRDLIHRETVSSIEGDQQFTFTHVLIRDVAYDLLPRSRRQRLHEHYASFLEGATSEIGEAGAAIARHWRDAGDPVRAVRYFIAAAEQAEQGWAKDRAVDFYREALQLVPAGDDQRKQVLKRLAIASQAAYHVRDARALRGGSG